MQNIKLEQIYNGQSPSYLNGGDYLSSIAIDPDADVSTSIKKIAGAITPTAHTEFMEVDGNPMWVKPNPVTDEVLVYTDNGKLHQFDKTLTEVNTPITITNASGNGLTYYNNYYYAIKDNNIDRFKVDDLTQDENWFTSLKEKDVIIYTPITEIQTQTFDQFYFGNGQTYSEVAQLIPGSTIGTNNSINVLKIQLKGFGFTTTNLRLRIYPIAVSSTEPSGTLFDTVTFQIDNTLKVYEIPFSAPSTSSRNFWFRIDKEGGFGTGEYVQIVTTTSTAITGGKLFGYDGTWDDTGDNAAFFLYNEYQAFPEITNTTYPLNGITNIPNHAAHVHSDNKMYVSDYSGGVGRIHSIQTLEEIEIYGLVESAVPSVGSVIYGDDSMASAEVVAIDYGFGNSVKNGDSTTKITVINRRGEFIEDEELRSADFDSYGNFQEIRLGYARGEVRLNALNLPQGMLPVALESFGSDLAVLAINGTDDTLRQGNARLYLWDTFDVSFYREIKLPYATATALLSHNGIPFLWGGDDRGYSFSQYAGGDSVSEIFYIDDGKPPFAGAVAGENNRIIWGSNVEYPESAGAVLAWGSRNASLPKGLHNIARSINQVTSLFVATKNTENIIIGEQDSILKPGGSYNSILRTKVINVGKNFTVKGIHIPLASEVNENTSITVKCFVDNESRSKTLNTINNTNHSGKTKVVDYFEITGENNFFVEFKWSGTEAIPILLPITIEVEVLEE